MTVKEKVQQAYETITGKVFDGKESLINKIQEQFMENDRSLMDIKNTLNDARKKILTLPPASQKQLLLAWLKLRGAYNKSVEADKAIKSRLLKDKDAACTIKAHEKIIQGLDDSGLGVVITTIVIGTLGTVLIVALMIYLNTHSPKNKALLLEAKGLDRLIDEIVSGEATPEEAAQKVDILKKKIDIVKEIIPKKPELQPGLVTQLAGIAPYAIIGFLLFTYMGKQGKKTSGRRR